MTLWRCRRCGTTFAVGLPYCPQCTGTDVEEDGAMPKITRHGGVSDQTEGSDPRVAQAGTEPPAEAEAAAHGGPERPAADAPKGVWVSWAVAVGYDEAVVKAMRKSDIQNLPDRPELGADGQIVGVSPDTDSA